MRQLSSEHLKLQRTLKELAADGMLLGRFSDIPIEVYHHPETPGFSSSQIKSIIKRSPAHFKNEKPLIFGSAFHAFANEPELFNEVFLKGGYGDLDSEDFKLIRIMNQKLKAHPDVAELYVGAVHEQTFFAKDPKTGILLKCRADGYVDSKQLVWDLKTCGDASPTAFQYDCRKFFYRISAAYYLKVISLVMGSVHRDFLLVACEKNEPNEVAVYRVDERSISIGEMEIDEALARLANPDEFKGYKGIKEISI